LFASGQNRLTCPTAVCLLSQRADKPKRDLLSLERWHSIAVDQRDLSVGMVVDPVNAACRDEVARLDDKVLHANSIRGKSAL
jgi:hypothetical protein